VLGRFAGSSLNVTLDDSWGANWVAVEIDGAVASIIDCELGQSTYSIHGLAAGNHEFAMYSL
jgi:hypothetical protein